MTDLDHVLRMLVLAIQQLERAAPQLADVAGVQAARADVERVLAGFSVRSAAYVDNSSSFLRAAAKSLERIDNAEARAASRDILEAAAMIEDSIRDW